MKAIFYKMKNKKGGKRKGAGRKPLDPSFKKMPITIWLMKSDVERNGGEANVKILLSQKFHQYFTHGKD